MSTTVSSFVVGIVALAMGGCAVSSAAIKRSVDVEPIVSIAPERAAVALTPTPHAKSGPRQEAPDVKRQVIYSAALRITVRDIASSMNSVQIAAEEVGGYLQQIDGDSVVVRVPAAKFQATIEVVSKLGEVTGRQLKAQDVTEEMIDLKVRLKNTIDLRNRLAALLEKAEKMEDVIALERELTRVTEHMERIQGRIQFLQSNVAMSTLRVEFNSPLPQRALIEQLPFRWVHELGDGLVMGTTRNETRRRGWFEQAANLRLPKDFVAYYRSPERTEAMNADQVLIKVRSHGNPGSGSIEFWSKLCRRMMVASRGLAVSSEKMTPGGDGRTAVYLLVGTRQISGKDYGYLLGITRSANAVHTFEAWGPAKKFAKSRDALVDSASKMVAR